MSLPREMGHSLVLKLVNYLFYKDVFQKYHLQGQERLLRDRDTGNEVKGFDLFDETSMKTYFIRTTDVEKFPIKINNSMETVQNNKVYHLATDVDSIKIEANDDMPLPDFIDTIFPLKSTHEYDLFLGKICIITSTVSRAYPRIISKQSFGKDGIVDSIINISNQGTNIDDASSAKLGQVIDSGFAVFNEVAGYSGETRRILQRFFLNTAEPNKQVYEHITTGSDKTKSKYDISNFGYSIVHNIPEYYIEKGIPTFEQMFTPAVFYRVFPIELFGQVDDNEFINQQLNAQKVVKENLENFKRLIAKWNWLKNNLHYVVPYSILKYDLSQGDEITSRWNITFTNIAKFVTKYVQDGGYDEDKFYEIMDTLVDRHQKYIKKIKEYGLI